MGSHLFLYATLCIEQKQGSREAGKQGNRGRGARAPRRRKFGHFLGVVVHFMRIFPIFRNCRRKNPLFFGDTLQSSQRTLAPPQKIRTVVQQTLFEVQRLLIYYVLFVYLLARYFSQAQADARVSSTLRSAFQPSSLLAKSGLAQRAITSPSRLGTNL